MMLKTKVDIHVFQLLKKYFYDMLSLENIISDTEPNSQTSRKKIVLIPIKFSYDFV